LSSIVCSTSPASSTGRLLALKAIRSSSMAESGIAASWRGVGLVECSNLSDTDDQSRRRAPGERGDSS
jgi:hypothetical protein